MKLTASLLILIVIMSTFTLFDFNTNSDLTRWNIVDDVVMGGKSDGNFSLNHEGHGVFSGKVSLENNGGFSSVQYSFKPVDVSNYKTVCILLKGDGKDYQFRLKKDQNDYYSYKKEFTTNGDWQTIRLALTDFKPTFRGRTLDIPNFDSAHLEQITFLIANKKEQSFKLMLDRIWLEQ